MDILAIYVAWLEVWSTIQHTWPFTSTLCPLYRGSEILVNSLTIYLLVCLNFHVISIWNMHMYETNKSNKCSLSYAEDDSNECLVKKNDTVSSRTLTIDYRRKKDDIPVIFPSLLIWFICLSLSVPEYILSTTVVSNVQNSTICTIIDVNYIEVIQNLLLVFREAIPLPLFIFSLIILIRKYVQTRKISNDDLKNIRVLIIFCVSLACLYVVTSFAKHIFYILHVTTVKMIGNDLESFKIPPLYNAFVSPTVMKWISILQYSWIPFKSFIFLFLISTPVVLGRNKDANE